MTALQSYTDEQLFLLIKGSNELAFTELYDRYWKKLLVRAHILLNNREDAEEVIHDIFVQLWRKRATIELNNRFVTYLSAMLRYGCFKILARQKRRLHSGTDVKSLEIMDDSTCQYLDFEYLRIELEKEVSQLPEKCQLIFRYSRETGLTDKQIAEKLHISVNTVRTQMGRALKKLKTSLRSFFIL